MFFNHDSAFDLITKRFMEDSAFMFRNFDDRRGMHIRRMPPFPHHRIFEDEIIFDYDSELDSINGDVIIEKSPGKKRIIIKDSSGDMKTIHKNLDDDTEIIIIKKDSKKTKPEKHISRKRER